MPVNTQSDYIEFGTSINPDNTLNNSLILPAPNSIPFSNEFMASAERNGNGTMMLQQIGRTQYIFSITWKAMKNTLWWKLNRWLEDNQYVFYAKYFNHATGRVQIQKFYRGNIEKATPSPHTEIINGYNVPTKYYDCSFSVIDIGESSVITINEFGVI